MLPRGGLSRESGRRNWHGLDGSELLLKDPRKLHSVQVTRVRAHRIVGLCVLKGEPHVRGELGQRPVLALPELCLDSWEIHGMLDARPIVGEAVFRKDLLPGIVEPEGLVTILAQGNQDLHAPGPHIVRLLPPDPRLGLLRRRAPRDRGLRRLRGLRRSRGCCRYGDGRSRLAGGHLDESHLLIRGNQSNDLRGGELCDGHACHVVATFAVRREGHLQALLREAPRAVPPLEHGEPAFVATAVWSLGVGAEARRSVVEVGLHRLIPAETPFAFDHPEAGLSDGPASHGRHHSTVRRQLHRSIASR
mmetsp:Transcript_13840/g.51665  ORF Transcript_13840/g.51665 Transcript_13840/m.51665 type:complete len:305 (+) Transcript_13840:2471-3385(+)